MGFRIDRYTKIYSGEEPELIEGDVFRTIVPITLAAGLLADNGSLSDKMSDNAYRKVILAYIAGHGEISAATTAKIIERSPETARRVLAQLVREGVLAATGANRNRKYRAAK